MNYEELMKAMVRKYAFEDTSRFQLSEEERISHIVAEAQYMVAKKYGFNTVQEMDEAMVQKSGKWQDYMDKSSKHLPMRRAR
jgi:hypothetical protein